MINLYVAVMVANSDMQVFKSRTAYPTQQACEARVEGEVEHFKEMLKEVPEAKVLGGKCIDDKDLKNDDNSI